MRSNSWIGCTPTRPTASSAGARRGAREFILKGEANASMEYGFFTYGTYQRVQEEAIEFAYSREQRESGQKAAGWVEDEPNPYLWVALTSEEQNKAATFKDELFNYADEQISKFILGQRPLTEWDAFGKELKDMHADELIAIYQGAYARVSE